MIDDMNPARVGQAANLIAAQWLAVGKYPQENKEAFAKAVDDMELILAYTQKYVSDARTAQRKKPVMPEFK
jgi:hypothetical protein